MVAMRLEQETFKVIRTSARIHYLTLVLGGELFFIFYFFCCCLYSEQPGNVLKKQNNDENKENFYGLLFSNATNYLFN